MRRDDFITQLKTVDPARAKKSMVPLLTHYWFTGGELLAYNDQIALSVPFRSQYKGAVSDIMLQLLEASLFKNITISGHDGELLVKKQDSNNDDDGGGTTACKLAMLPPEFLFTMPRMQSSRGVGPVESVVKAIEHCLLSVDDTIANASVVEQLGVTVVRSRDKLTFFSTDKKTISRAEMLYRDRLEFDHIIIPAEFCRQMVKLYGDGDKSVENENDRRQFQFEVSNRQSGRDSEERYVLFEAGDTLLYGRIIESETPLNFTSVLDTMLPSNIDDLPQVPPRFASALNRAAVVCDSERRSVRIEVANGEMRFLSKTDTEELRDVVPEVPRKQPSVTIAVEPKLLKRGIDFKKMLIRDSCVIMSKGQMLFVVACHRGDT